MLHQSSVLQYSEGHDVTQVQFNTVQGRAVMLNQSSVIQYSAGQ